jgi:oxygen-independent coproporphyrinogen-3 oxidase
VVESPGGGRSILYRWRGSSTDRPPLVLAHGTLSGAEAVHDLGRALAEAGFDCWLFEWGGHGGSQTSTRRQDFEHPALHDVPAAIAKVLEHTGQPRVFWVSHSGGGLLLLMHLARHPERQVHIAGLVTMGAQATDAGPGLVGRAQLYALQWVTTLLGRTPKVMLPSGSEEEPTRLLAQWARWNLRGRWQGADGFDYLPALAQLTVPALVMAGAQDVIAPASGCRRVFEGLGAVDKTWVLCGASTGFSRDFSHGQLVRGRAARAEIFPLIRDWLAARVTVTPA